MKTLKQWYDGLSEGAQNLIQKECVEWFDVNQPDYYRKKPNYTKEQITSLLKMGTRAFADKFELSYSSRQVPRRKLFMLMSYLIDNKELDPSILDDLISKELSGYDYNKMSEWLYVSDARKKEIYKLYTNPDFPNSRYTLWEYLYLIEDFSSWRLDWEHVVRPLDLTTEVREIIGEDNARDIAKDNYEKLAYSLKPKEECSLFDELFFGENGWSDYTKDQIIYRYVRGKSDKATNNLPVVEDFIWRFVCVNPMKYLPKLYDMIYNDPALGTYIYQQKKPLDEIAQNHLRGEGVYKYSRLIRNIAKIANCCVRKSISRVTQKQLKELGPLVKLYGYDFHTIYNAMELDL